MECWYAKICILVKMHNIYFHFVFTDGVTMFVVLFGYLDVARRTSWRQKEAETIYKLIPDGHVFTVKCGCGACCCCKLDVSVFAERTNQMSRKEVEEYEANHITARAGYEFDEFVRCNECKHVMSGLFTKKGEKMSWQHFFNVKNLSFRFVFLIFVFFALNCWFLFYSLDVMILEKELHLLCLSRQLKES